jgi:hypothetical protein
MPELHLDPDCQPLDSPEQDNPGRADTLAAQCYRLAAVDAQGCEHCGQAIVSQDWQPQLGQLAEDDFCIVILSEPLSGSLGPIATGVVVCVPGQAVSGRLRLRETATAYKVKERKGQAPDSEETLTLSASAMTALASGQLLANPPLEISPADIFSPRETAPRLGLLAQALLTQRAAQPYLDALAVAVAAPADAAASAGLADLLPALGQALAEAREKAPQCQDLLADVPRMASAPESLASLSEATTTAAFAETACRLYCNASDLAEDIYLCRALAENPDDASKMAYMRCYLMDAVVSESEPELAIDRTLALEELSFATLVAEPHRWAAMRAAFERFRQRYQCAYLKHHHQYCETLLTVHAQLLDLVPHAQALRRLNTLRELGPPLGEEALAEYEDIPQRVSPCTLCPSLERELAELPRCPVCNISMNDEPPWEDMQRVRHRLERALNQQLQRLSSKAVSQILATSGEARVEQFVQLVQASQARSLADVLDDDLLGFLRRLLAEARVKSLLAPVFAKLQEPIPDLSEEAVEDIAEEVARVIHDAFTASQQALPREERPQLTPGTSEPSAA